jgi:hypothetical protein
MSSAKVTGESPPGNPADASLSNLPAWATYLDAIVSPLQVEHTQLVQLTVPQTWRQKFQGLVADQATAVMLLQTSAVAARSGDLSAFRTEMARFQQVFDRINSSARALGLDSCSS